MLVKIHVEIPFYFVIKEVQNDRGGEFMFLTRKLQSKGFLHCVTCPHTLKHNGMVESRHRQVL